MSNEKFTLLFCRKNKKPYPQSINPELGPNFMFDLENLNCISIELREQGKGILGGKEVEYADIRVYLEEKR